MIQSGGHSVEAASASTGVIIYLGLMRGVMVDTHNKVAWIQVCIPLQSFSVAKKKSSSKHTHPLTHSLTHSHLSGQGGSVVCDIDREASVHGLAVPMGIVPTVGAAGIIQGAGYGMFTRLWGFTSDNVLELEVL